MSHKKDATIEAYIFKTDATGVLYNKNMDLKTRKPVFVGLQITKMQISPV